MSQVASSPAQSGRGPDRPPVRARSGRKPLPPLVFLLVLAVATTAVWIWVFRSGSDTTPTATCTPAAPSMAPGTVTVHVLNASQKQGAASAVAKELQARGFQVGAPDNDRSGREVTGVGEIRFGARGKQQAAYVKAYLPGATEYQDTRATAVVDMVIGPGYQSLATQQAVTAAIEAPTC